MKVQMLGDELWDRTKANRVKDFSISHIRPTQLVRLIILEQEISEDLRNRGADTEN